MKICCAIHYLFLTLYASECCLLHSDSAIVSYMSRYALLHGRMSSLLGVNALYCRLRYGLDVSSIFSHQFNPGRIIWKRHMYNISPELQVRVEVLKDMLMYRGDKRQCLLTNDELESIIHFICTE